MALSTSSNANFPEKYSQALFKNRMHFNVAQPKQDRCKMIFSKSRNKRYEFLVFAISAAFCSVAGPLAYASDEECLALQNKINTKSTVTDIRQVDWNLFEAADKGCLDIAKRMLEQGAKAETRRNSGESVLHVAARSGEVEIAALLIDQGADFELRDLKGATPLFVAVESKRKDMVNLLLARGAKVNAPGRTDTTPLAAAAFNGSVSIIKMLLDAKADPTTADLTGKTATIYAAARGFKPIVEQFLDAGVDVNEHYQHNLTLLMWAAGHANDVPEKEGRALVSALIDRGAKLDEIDDRGMTALMISAELGHVETIQELVSRGAAKDLKSKQGKTATDYALSPAAKSAVSSQ
jgi:uncharacterized protein